MASDSASFSAEEGVATAISIALETIPPARERVHAVDPPYPECERRIDRMFWLSLLPSIRHSSKAVRIGIPVIVNAVLAPATFCMLYYPSYYPTQGIVWSTDIAISWVAYNYMLYLQRIWHQAACFEHTEVRSYVHRVSFAFYILYILYWFYFAVIQFSTHNEPSVLIQLGNTLMSTAWYIFFSTVSVVYYYICIKLSQRSESLKSWIWTLRPGQITIEKFYIYYNIHNRRITLFSKNWNFLIFMAIVLLTFHVPIDLVSVMYNKYYYDIFGLIIKLFSLMWYLARICDLNDSETYLISHLYKYRVFPTEQIQELETYMSYRPISLDFYGLKITKAYIAKVVLFGVNLLVPTLYAVASNRFFNTDTGATALTATTNSSQIL